MKSSIVASRVLLGLLITPWFIYSFVVGVDLTITVSNDGDNDDYLIEGESDTPLEGVTLFLRRNGTCAAFEDFNVTAAEGGPLNATISMTMNQAVVLSLNNTVLEKSSEAPLMVINTQITDWCIGSVGITNSFGSTGELSVFESMRICNCTSPPGPSSSSDGERLSAAEWIGIAIAVVFLVSLGGLVFYAAVRKNRGERNTEDDLEANTREMEAGSSRRSARGVQIEMVPLRRERESPPSSSSSEDEEDERRVGGARGKAKLDEIYDADDERSLDSNSSSGSSDSTESYLSARSELSSESSSSSGSYTSSDESNSSLSPNDSDSDTPKMTESEIQRALHARAPARADKRKPPRTIHRRILNAYLDSIAEHPETRMPADEEKRWLESQHAKVAQEERDNEIRGSELTSSDSSHYSSASEMLDSSTGEEFEHSSGAESDRSGDEERLHEIMRFSYSMLLAQRAEEEPIGATSPSTSEKDTSTSGEEETTEESTQAEEGPATEAE